MAQNGGLFLKQLYQCTATLNYSIWSVMPGKVRKPHDNNIHTSACHTPTSKTSSISPRAPFTAGRGKASSTTRNRWPGMRPNTFSWHPTSKGSWFPSATSKGFSQKFQDPLITRGSKSLCLRAASRAAPQGSWVLETALNRTTGPHQKSRRSPTKGALLACWRWSARNWKENGPKMWLWCRRRRAACRIVSLQTPPSPTEFSKEGFQASPDPHTTTGGGKPCCSCRSKSSQVAVRKAQMLIKPRVPEVKCLLLRLTGKNCHQEWRSPDANKESWGWHTTRGKR